MSKSDARMYDGSATRKAMHAPASSDNRKDALCGLTNTRYTVRNATTVMGFGRSISVWKGDKLELMVNCQKCRKVMGLVS